MRTESFTSLVHTESTTDHSFGVSLHIGTRTYLPRFKETQGTPTSATADQPRLAAKGMPMIARAAMASFPGLIREGHLAVLLEVDILASFLYDCYISIYIYTYISIRIYLVQSEMIISSNTVLIIVYSCISSFICGMIFLSTSHIITSVLHQFSPWFFIFPARYEGSWQNGKQHGQGRYYHLDPLATALFKTWCLTETNHQWTVPKITMDIYTIPYKRTI